jgi:(hydroxyamino)benzene mutase
VVKCVPLAIREASVRAKEITAMTDDPRRRALMRQGFLFLLLALVLGLAIIALPHPSRWLAAHLTAFLTGLILVVIALAWNELRLTNGQRTLAYTTGLVAAYGGLVGNVFGAITDLPGPASNPGVAPPMPQAGVFLAILAIIVPSLFVSFGLVLYGMRGAATER